MTAFTAEHARAWLETLCNAHPDRHVGGPGNRAANLLFERVAASAGFETEVEQLRCLDWHEGPAHLSAGAEVFELKSGPYSPPLETTAPLAAASSVEELERGGFTGQVLLVHGELAREQLMPKNFPFYNPDPHRRIVAALEAAGPVAVLAATGQNPELAGGVYPFPLLSDGDFELPSAYLKDVDGERLLRHRGQPVQLRIDSARPPSSALQVVARKRGHRPGRVLVTAHIDTVFGTPGALDNASGVCVLLGLTSLLADYRGALGVELVPFNGEDNYAVPGQRRWLEQNQGRMADLALNVNLDGAGFAGQPTAVSFYGCPAGTEAAVKRAMAPSGFVVGPQWPQGDHSVLSMHGVPAVAVTSENVFFIGSTVAHTEKDRPQLVDPEALVRVARFCARVLEELGG